jgi:hypothetical protein
MTRVLRGLTALALGGVVAACSSASTPSGPDPLPLTVTGEAGELRVQVSAPGGAPVVGNDSVELSVVRASDGAPADGLTVSVVPWMPSMDHGTSGATVTGQGGGRYLVSDLYLFMPGTWVLKIAFSGPATDNVQPEIPVQ